MMFHRCYFFLLVTGYHALFLRQAAAATGTIRGLGTMKPTIPQPQPEITEYDQLVALLEESYGNRCIFSNLPNAVIVSCPFLTGIINMSATGEPGSFVPRWLQVCWDEGPEECQEPLHLMGDKLKQTRDLIQTTKSRSLLHSTTPSMQTMTTMATTTHQ